MGWVFVDHHPLCFFIVHNTLLTVPNIQHPCATFIFLSSNSTFFHHLPSSCWGSGSFMWDTGKKKGKKVPIFISFHFNILIFFFGFWKPAVHVVCRAPRY